MTDLPRETIQAIARKAFRDAAGIGHLLGSERIICDAVVEAVLHALESSGSALLSREDREDAYQLAWASGYQNHSNESGDGWRDDKIKARRLLKLEAGQ
jgi:hypothetical protein